MKKQIFFSDHLKQCVLDANKVATCRQDVLSYLYDIAISKALELAKEQGKGTVYRDDFLFEVNKINNMFNMFLSDKKLRGYILPACNWFKDTVSEKLAKLESE